MADGKVVWEVTLDDSNVITGIKDITKEIKTESKKWDDEAKKNLDKIDTNTESTAKSMTSALDGVAIAVGEAFVKLTVTILSELAKWAAASINVASSLEQIDGVVEATFGESGTAKINEWAKKAGSQFGYTELEAKKFTSTLGIMMKSAGLSSDEAATMSTSLAGLASDMAALYNLEPDKAFGKIQSAMQGGASALKEFGIEMSNTRMDEYMKSMEMEGSFKDLSQTEQYLLRYQFIMEKLQDANGEYARSASETFEGVNNQIKTKVDIAQENVGKALLPYVKQLQQEFLGLLNLITGDDGVVITGNQNQLNQWLEDAKTSAADARKELDAMGDTYGSLAGVSRDDFEPGIFSNYGEFVLQSLYSRQQWSRGEQRGKIDAAIIALEQAYGKVTQAEGQISDYEAQLNKLATDTPDTAAAGQAIVSDLVDGLASKEGDLQAEVDAINGILNGIGNGGMSFGSGDIPIDGSHAVGLNYVPFDGYLAQLHEGEGILTSEENKIWQRFKTRSQSIDYDTMGGVMRDNIRPGGNVYLDGKRVGTVISEQQGRAYKSLQRSGWQA